VGPQVVRGAQEGVNATYAGIDGIGRWFTQNVVDLGHISIGPGSKGWGPDGWLTWNPGSAPKAS
jgi:hypothetical protein